MSAQQYGEFTAAKCVTRRYGPDPVLFCVSRSKLSPRFFVPPRFRFASQIDAPHSHGTTGGNESASEGRKVYPYLPFSPAVPRSRRRPAHFLQTTAIFTIARQVPSISTLEKYGPPSALNERTQVLYVERPTLISSPVAACIRSPPPSSSLSPPVSPSSHCYPHFAELQSVINTENFLESALLPLSLHRTC